MDIDHPLYCASVREWHHWLEKYRAQEKEVWLLRYKKNSGTPSVTYSEAVEEAISFGWIDGKVKGIDSEKSAIRFSPRKTKSIWSKTNKDRAERLVKEGRMTPSGKATIEAAKKSGAWDKAYDTRKITEPPDDLLEALSGNKEAKENFEKFAPGYRNQYMLWIDDAKTPETRKRRINAVVVRSGMNKKPGIDLRII